MGARHDRRRSLLDDHPNLGPRLASVQPLRLSPLFPLLAPRSHSRPVHPAWVHGCRKRPQRHLHPLPDQDPPLEIERPTAPRHD